MRVLGERPTHRPEPHPDAIPAEAEIYNGAQPLMGSIADDMGLTWQSHPVLGSYFAAILPGDPLAEGWRAFNRDAGAVLVEYVTLDQVRQALTGYYAEALMMSPAEISERLGAAGQAELWQQYVEAGLHVELVEVEPVAA